jgi:hypothetical protein
MGDKTIRNWEKDLPGLTDESLRERWALAREFEASSMKRGSGRNPKAARMWRDKLRAAEAEIARRGLRL